MLTVIIILVAGMTFGYFFQEKTKLIKFITKSTIWIIFALLFFLGLTVGKNPEIMQNLNTIGLLGFEIALVSLLGSMFLAWGLFHLFFKNQNHER